MKAVIKKQTHYSLLLMRDDGEVRSFRMKNTTLRFLGILLMSFLMTGAGGVWVGYHYWKRYSDFIPEYREQERALADLSAELQQLRNIRAVVMAQNNGAVPVAMNTEVGLNAPDATAAAVNGGSLVNGTSRNGDAGTGSLAPAVSGSANTAAGLPENLGGAVNATSTGETAASGEPASAGTVPSLSEDTSPVRVNEFSAQATSQQTLRIRYDLSVSQLADTGQEGGPVVGSAKYVALFTNGTRMDLAQQSPVNSRFAISRMKPMMASSRLPQGYSTAEITSVDVVIELAGGAVYRETYPFPQ